jgi:hypothetical protein
VLLTSPGAGRAALVIGGAVLLAFGSLVVPQQTRGLCRAPRWKRSHRRPWRRPERRGAVLLVVDLLRVRRGAAASR